MAFDDSILAGSTSKIIEVMIRDSTTNQGKTGLAHSSVTDSYVREGSTRVAITSAAGTAGDAYSSGKWAEVDSTNCPGLYQFHLPNAAIAAGAAAVTVQFKATGCMDKSVRIKLVAHNVQDATRLGLTALPNVSIPAGTGFPAVDASNGVNVRQIMGQVLSLSGNVVTFPFGVLLQPTATSTVALNIRGGDAATGVWIRGGNYNATPDATGSGLVIATGTDSGNSGAHRSIILTKGATNTEGVSVTGNINAVLDTVTTTTTATNLTTNNDKTGYSLTATTGLGNQTANITGNLSGSVGSVTGAVGSVTGAVGSVTGNVGGNVTGSVGSISGITFPTNFSTLGINASGHITRVVLADTATTLTNLPAITANWLTAAGIATDAGTELATALLDLTDGIETGLTLRGATRLIAAASAGKLSGAATTTVVVRNVGDTKARLTATVDSDGNRTAVTADAT